MRNPFARPQTLGQWLLGSVCWVVVGALIEVIFSEASIRQALSPGLTEALGLGRCGLLHGLLWWQVCAGVRLYTPNLRRSPLLTLAGLLWLGLLVIGQVFGLLFLAFGLLFALGGPILQF